ncbi:MAG: tetratricopeptide repeat protein [Pseudomonadota bacterium]
MTQQEWTENDTKVLQVLASVLTSQGKENRAATLLEYALDKEPDNISVKKALGGVYTLLNKYEEAVSMIDAALADNPTPADLDRLLLVRSEALWKGGREGEAREMMQRYIHQRQAL